MSDTPVEEEAAAEVVPFEPTDEQKAAGYPGINYDEQREAMTAVAAEAAEAAPVEAEEA